MAEITASLVKDLREKTGAGMMDCKKALAESNGDFEAAADWLRSKGLAAAAKKSGRVAAEGLVGVSVSGTAGALVEVNSETDFVARNEHFQKLVSTIADLALSNGGDFEALKATGFPGEARTVAEQVTHLVATIGENMNLRRSASLSVPEGVVAGYIHNATAPGLGKIGVIVAVKSSGDAARLEAFGKQVAMHIAAVNPQSLNVADLDPKAIEKERAFVVEQSAGSGKPANVIEKMVEGRMRKFYEEVVLLKQTFVIDGESKVEQAVEKLAKDLGAPVEITGFVRFALGEGIEKEEKDFAAEVAAAAGR